MGDSRLTDVLTGLSIPSGDPVVALVIDRRRGGYPDATTHSVMSPLSASHAFEPTSLPIRGKAGSYGDIVPARGDPAAAALLDLAGRKDWASLAGAAFGVDGAIKLGAAARGEDDRWGDAEEAEARPLGLAVFGAKTWDQVLRLGAGDRSREADVAVMLEAFAESRRAYESGDVDAYVTNLDLWRLAKSSFRKRGPSGAFDPRPTRLPPLGSALSHREGGDMMSGLASRWLCQHWIGTARSPVDPPRLAKCLELVWDLGAAEQGMRDLGRTWQPSCGIGQYDNTREIADMAIGTLAAATDRLLAAFEEGYADDEVAVPGLQGLMDRMDAIKASVERRIEAARASSPGP